MEPIHLFRNLLRQASILFDDVARAHTAKLIISGFRRNQKLEDAWTIHQKIKKGRQALSLLHWANAGEPKPLGKVLDLAYGRDGRRRHELLQVGRAMHFWTTSPSPFSSADLWLKFGKAHS